MQMPVEGRQFQACDKYWRGLMEAVLVRPEMLLVVDIEGLQVRLTETNTTLAAIEKKLTDYLVSPAPIFPPTLRLNAAAPAGTKCRLGVRRLSDAGARTALTGHEEDGLPALLVPVQRRAAGDPA
jgi:hypothetical protein